MDKWEKIVRKLLNKPKTRWLVNDINSIYRNYITVVSGTR